MENTTRRTLPPGIAGFLWRARQRRRWTLRQAAREVGIGASYLTALEHGERCPSVAVAEDLARVLLYDRPHQAAMLLEHARPAAGRSSPYRART